MRGSVCRSAAIEGSVDYILPPHQIAQELLRIARHPYAAETAPTAPSGDGETGEPVETFVIITTRANKLLSEVHEDMPVIIAPADYQRWLTGPAPMAKRLLIPYTGGMTIARVSDRVNDIKQDDVGLIAPVAG